MPAFIDITGQKFGMLTAIKRVENSGKQTRYLFKCECGNSKEINAMNVKRGMTRSCGCFNSKIAKINAQQKFKDVTGKTFGKLKVVKQANRSKSGHLQWICLCECENTITIESRKLLKGDYKSCGCARIKTGKNHHNWKGGKYTNKDGYVLKRVANHPSLNSRGYVPEHRLNMEKKLGRFLLPNENVHHKNGIRNDNRLNNLELWISSQPAGQRVEDLIEFSLCILQEYAPERLK